MKIYSHCIHCDSTTHIRKNVSDRGELALKYGTIDKHIKIKCNICNKEDLHPINQTYVKPSKMNFLLGAGVSLVLVSIILYVVGPYVLRTWDYRLTEVMFVCLGSSGTVGLLIRKEDARRCKNYNGYSCLLYTSPSPRDA